MPVYDKHLVVKTSVLKGSGRGLFTKVFIPRGSLITEYKGKISSWKKVDHDEGRNPYIFYINKDHVIDAKKTKGSVAHFANDAKGFTSVPGLRNNSMYTVKGKKVFIKSIKDIQPGDEILVGYGKQYWEVMRSNKV